MAGVNKVILVGNLGKDPEIKYLENGRVRASFSMATSESYKNKEGEKVTSTEWHNIVLWTPLAEIAEKYLQKGKQVYIEGKIVHRSYDDAGTTKYVTEVVGRELRLLGSRGDMQDEPNRDVEQPEEAPSEAPATEEGGMDDLPF